MKNSMMQITQFVCRGGDSAWTRSFVEPSGKVWRDCNF